MPDTALPASLGRLGLMEALEDPLLLIAWNAGTGIGHFDRVPAGLWNTLT